jgi:prepilin-type N-terminal cleavage/methylation domain-containing protein
MGQDVNQARAPGAAQSQDDAGFTLVELLIALSVLTVTMVPMTRVFWSGLRTAASSSHRTDASAIAARETERMHADPYPLVGFYRDQVPADWKGASTVILGSCSTSCPIAFAPLIQPTAMSTPVPGNTGITYSIARYVYWADTQGMNSLAVSTTFVQAYKAATVVVTWTDETGNHRIQQDSIIYPGGRGVYSGPGGSMATTTTTAPQYAPGTPGLVLAATAPLPPLDQQEIDVALNAPVSGGPVSGYELQWATDLLFMAPAQSPQLPPSSSSYALQGLAASTTYFVRAFASNNTGQSAFSAVVSATTAAMPVTTTLPATTLPATTLPSTTIVAPPPTTTTVPTTTTTIAMCNLGAFTITTSTTGKTYLTKGGAMTENIALNLSVNGTCVWVVVASSVLHGTSTVDPNAPYVFVGAPIGGQWSATILSSGQTNWSVGIHDMSILLSGRATTVTHGLLICAWTPPGQRSSSANVC